MLRAQGKSGPGGRVTVRILFVEDSQDDVELQLRRLREAGLEPQWDRVADGGGASRRAGRRVLAGRARRLQHPGVLGHRGPASHRRAGAGPAGDHGLREHRRGHGRGDHVGRRRGLRAQGQPHPAAPGGARAVDGADLRRAHRRAAEAARLALFALDYASLAIADRGERRHRRLCERLRECFVRQGAFRDDRVESSGSSTDWWTRRLAGRVGGASSTARTSSVRQEFRMARDSRTGRTS